MGENATNYQLDIKIINYFNNFLIHFGTFKVFHYKKYHLYCNKEFVFAKTDDLALPCFQEVVFIRLERYT